MGHSECLYSERRFTLTVDSPLAYTFTSIPALANPSAKWATKSSVPPYSAGGTAIKVGAIRAIFYVGTSCAHWTACVGSYEKIAAHGCSMLRVLPWSSAFAFDTLAPPCETVNSISGVRQQTYGTERHCRIRLDANFLRNGFADS